MNVETIEVDRDHARRQLDEYAEAMGRSTDPEYAQVMAALHHQVEGRAVLQLSRTRARARSTTR